MNESNYMALKVNQFLKIQIILFEWKAGETGRLRAGETPDGQVLPYIRY